MFIAKSLTDDPYMWNWNLCVQLYKNTVIQNLLNFVNLPDLYYLETFKMHLAPLFLS